MLVCPECKFENPNNNKFCQKCGTSLTTKKCDECGAEVPLSAAQCQNCDAFTGTVLWAIISQNAVQSAIATPTVATTIQAAANTPILTPPETLSSEVPTANTLNIPDLNPFSETYSESIEKNPEDENCQVSEPVNISSSVVDNSQPVEAATQDEISLGDDSGQSPATATVLTQEYLGVQQRYKIIAPTPLSTSDGQFEVRVLDCQPFQKSPLEALMGQQQGIFKSSAPGEEADIVDSGFLNAVHIPALAQPYLKLNSSLSPTLPGIHDAWEENDYKVLLLEDRSQWSLLVDVWRDEQVPIFEILYNLNEMAHLWEALEPFHCRQSLLEITNLRVDEDHKFSLQKLYEEPSSSVTLQNLGEFWQTLFQQSQRTPDASLEQLVQDVATGKVESIEQVYEHLRAIANELQPEQSIEDTEETAGFSITDNFKEDITESEDADAPTVILPMQLVGLEDAGETDIGRQRNHNEDSFAIQTQIKKQETPQGRSIQARGLYIICDGMGGHAGGEVASSMAVQTLKQYFEENWKEQLPDENSIREAVRRANSAIYDVNQQKATAGSGRMGTTLVMLLVQDTKIAIAHVGDSRIYRLTRKRGLEQITIDHEVGQREIQRGVEPAIAYSRPDAYQLTQALGPRDENFVKPDVNFLELQEDTLLILASDGLTDNDLLEVNWQNALLPLLRSHANLTQGVEQLIDLANQHNGHDNITALLVRAKVRPNAEKQQGF
ncbi:protein serine/threonine phosphatase [Crinalium epipsammum PCC 9333]|uniref:Protein serine/threonine phosphatase n=1 Tax=Crinalium epipsammum PCC 9333 TaxID=1173022 RepID=K9W202_9CYAN|nr:serine/threonine phosphatase [Crinalium epipsammum]AFZ13829.1 protein serine/threonine phosphatase [Crinalium epipsammum PCC 9333]